ncbi:MAG: pyruvate, phosphate dikinase [Myxococcota bacterium]
MHYVYRFVDEPPSDNIVEILGGKGTGLNRMTRMGVPVPPGFTITTEVSGILRREGHLSEEVRAQALEALAWVEQDQGKRFGDPAAPLLISVRSGASVSMPGMMDTILNVGLNASTVEGLAAESQNRRFAFDAYRRLIQMYGNVVIGVDQHLFEEALVQLKGQLGDPRMPDTSIPADAMQDFCGKLLELIEKESDTSFPEDCQAQLWGAIHSVFASWENPRAIRYRKMQGIPQHSGTACTVQAMVFGNLGSTSGSGVAFTRNPSNGKPGLYGEFLENAQGEDVVAGIRTPHPLTAAGAMPGRETYSLESTMPDVFERLCSELKRLETHYRDVQDVEFTVERGRVFILQTRAAKRTAQAAVRIATDLVAEGSHTPEEAISMVDAVALDQLLHARLPSEQALKGQGIVPFARGLPASPGAVTGHLVFDSSEAEKKSGEGMDVILVRRETSPEDIHGMKAARGIVTATGGMTSHAAVVARGLGKCCVAGVSSLNIDYSARQVSVSSDSGVLELDCGDVVTIDGGTGCLYLGALEVRAAAAVPEFDQVMQWADDLRRMRIRANADTPSAATTARAFGAEGIGLCRTEHMFFSAERVETVRAVVLAADDESRNQFLDALFPVQRDDFLEIFRSMDGLPVTIRLLDWPLHEFLPRTDSELSVIAKRLGEPEATVKSRAERMHEVNPMLGHRGVRVGITMPQLYKMQIRAIFEAALLASRGGHRVLPEIMLPIVSLPEELEVLRVDIDTIANEVQSGSDHRIDYKVGTMIELPRACMVAHKIAAFADFISFGTNDLTQTTFGVSRDDSAAFLPQYLEDGRGLLSVDPFSRLDVEGVGELIRLAIERARSTRPDIKLGLCGEHGGDPSSIQFCEKVGLDYVSCSPPRLPVARLAAAQAALRSQDAR